MICPNCGENIPLPELLKQAITDDVFKCPECEQWWKANAKASDKVEQAEV